MKPSTPCLISVVQEDGTSQMVELTKQQMEELGIHFSTFMDFNHSQDGTLNANCTGNGKPLGSRENPIEIIKDGDKVHSRQNISVNYLKEITDALLLRHGKNDNSNVVYRIVYPEELNLKSATKSAKRGRPKKRDSITVEEKQEEEEVPAKSFRTRSGRITRRPPHVEQAYNEMNIFENGHTEPEKTSTPPETPPVEMEVPPTKENRKRPLASQYSCPKCNKKYLGRVKLIKHLERFPDHGSIPDYRENANCETWNFLHNLLSKTPVSKQGIQFIQEIFGFMKILRRISSLLFKSTNTCDKNNIFTIDDDFASSLGIKPGKYTLNEADLMRILDMFSYFDIQRFDNSFAGRKGDEPHRNGLKETEINQDDKQSTDVKNDKLENFNLNLRYPEVMESKIGKAENPNLCELLADNLLNSLPHLRTNENDLLLSNQATLLDTSSSSDELNVDQFVNERFKNITEVDLELTNNALNIDLPSMDIFQFHTS